MAEILASIDDINANLPSDADVPVVVANIDNTALLQISIARVVRGYLSRALDTATLVSWTNPSNTPDIIREVAAKLIASQLYFNKIAGQSSDIPERSVPQRLYDEAIQMLNDIIAGTIVIPDIPIPSTEMNELDFFPVDDTDRAFTLGMNL